MGFLSPLASTGNYSQPEDKSVLGFLGNLGEGVVNTAAGLAGLAGTAVSDLGGEIGQAFTGRDHSASIDDAIKAMPSAIVGDYKARYGSGLDNLLEALYQDPLSFAFDALDVAGVGLAAKGVRGAVRGAGAVDEASELVKIGKAEGLDVDDIAEADVAIHTPFDAAEAAPEPRGGLSPAEWDEAGPDQAQAWMESQLDPNIPPFMQGAPADYGRTRRFAEGMDEGLWEKSAEAQAYGLDDFDQTAEQLSDRYRNQLAGEGQIPSGQDKLGFALAQAPTEDLLRIYESGEDIGGMVANELRNRGALPSTVDDFNQRLSHLAPGEADELRRLWEPQPEPPPGDEFPSPSSPVGGLGDEVRAPDDVRGAYDPYVPQDEPTTRWTADFLRERVGREVTADEVIEFENLAETMALRNGFSAPSREILEEAADSFVQRAPDTPQGFDEMTRVRNLDAEIQEIFAADSGLAEDFANLTPDEKMKFVERVRQVTESGEPGTQDLQGVMDFVFDGIYTEREAIALTEQGEGFLVPDDASELTASPEESWMAEGMDAPPDALKQMMNQVEQTSLPGAQNPNPFYETGGLSLQDVIGDAGGPAYIGNDIQGLNQLVELLRRMFGDEGVL